MTGRPKMSITEKHERQKKLARERQRRRKERMSEERKEEKKKYDRERMAKLRAEGKVKKIKDMTPREQRKQRKYWREHNKVRSQKKAALQNVAATPPSSPGSNRAESSQKKRGRKQVRKDRAKAYRKIEKQSKEIKSLKKKVEKYKKRLQREKEKKKDQLASPSPRKKVAILLRREKVSPHVKKQLFLGFALRKQIKHQRKEVAGTKKKTQILHKLLGNNVLKRYKVQKHFQDLVPYNANRVIEKDGLSLEYTRKKRHVIQQTLGTLLTTFYEDDRVSRMCPGKKDFVKKGPVKKQRRILLDTLTNLHKLFQEETKIRLSKSTFCRARPFWVTFSKLADRETCACIKHANMEFLISALRKSDVITEGTSKAVIKSVVCQENEKCMLSQCTTCKNRIPEFKNSEDFKLKYWKWVNIKEDTIIKGVKKPIKKTVKIKEIKPISTIKSDLPKEIEIFKKHVYYASHQMKMVKHMTDNIRSGQLIFRVDFSENYVAKYASEVQAIHFGASKRQISLNTGVMYSKTNEGKVETVPFASVSDNLDHKAHAIWAHMKPILEEASKQYPDTTEVHLFTDSPTSQYRNKTNIHLLKTLIPKFFKNVITMTWNYTEAGHGKGLMDGVGGTLKRNAEQKVMHGIDITCSKDFIDTLCHVNIKLFEIPAHEISEMKIQVSHLDIPIIEGIMKVHQITIVKEIMFARKLSCFTCQPYEICKHYHQSKICPKDEKPIQKRKKKLLVEDIYTSSDEEIEQMDKTPKIIMPVPPENVAQFITPEQISSKLFCGGYILVEYKHQSRKCKTQKFVGVCQGEVLEGDIEVMFLKSNDHLTFHVNEKDISLVNINQVVALLPTPKMMVKGNRVYYQFFE